MFLYGQPSKPHSAQDDSLFEYVARHNGPLQDYHPQMLLQCLLWGAYPFTDLQRAELTPAGITEKVETVKEIIVNLARDVRETRAGNKAESEWRSIPIKHFLRNDGTIKSVRWDDHIVSRL
jgi:hypothetical protein